MSNFEEGFAVGYVLSKKKYSRGKKYDPIFHDILENSEAFCTIIIDDVYKFTLNLWVPLRKDIPDGRFRDWTPLTAVEAEGIGYSQTPVAYKKYVYVYRILWQNDKPLYAAFVSSSDYYNPLPWFIDIRKNLDKALPFKYYVYHKYVYEYIKGSAVANCDEKLYIKPSFKDGMNGTKIIEFDNIKIVDANGNSVNPRCTYKLKHRTYKEVYEKIECSDPSTGQTFTVNDTTKPPKIVLDRESEETRSIDGTVIRNTLFIYWFPIGNGATFSDLSEAQLDSLTDELMKSICEKYGDKSCHTHIPAEWLTPENKNQYD